MNSITLIRSELRKLTTTRMPLGFGIVLVTLAVINGIAVAVGTDMDGSKAFIATAADQQSLVAFAANALMIAGLFGAMATATEYSTKTAIGTYLNTPRRTRALGAQLVAVGLGGAVIGVVGAVCTITALAASLPFTDLGFLLSAGGAAQVIAASAWGGAAGAVLGGGLGSIVRNTGGAVTGAVLVLVIAPPLLVQLASGTAPWVPSTLANVVSGVAPDPETGTAAAIVAIGLWAVAPVVVALWSVVRRDVV